MSVWDCNVITVAVAFLFLFSLFLFFAVIKKGLEQLRGDSSCAAFLISLLADQLASNFLLFIYLFIFCTEGYKTRKANLNLCLAFSLPTFYLQTLFCFVIDV